MNLNQDQDQNQNQYQNLNLVEKNLEQYLKENAEKYPDKEALVFCHLKQRYTWLQVYQESSKVACGLLNLGISKGDAVSIWGTNHPQWIFTQLAAAMIGAPLVTINPEWKERELEFALRQSDSKFLIMQENFHKRSKDREYIYDYCHILQNLLSRQPELLSQQLKGVVIYSPTSGVMSSSYSDLISRDRVLSWNQFLQFHTQDENKQSEMKIDLDASMAQVSPRDLILIQYTSGTTGFPKGAMLTHYNVINNALMGNLNMQLSERDRLCGPVPYYHCFGSILLNLCGITSGATMVIPNEHFDAEKTLQVLREEKCTALHGVPTMFIEILAQLTQQKGAGVSSLRTGIMAGAPCPEELMRAVIEQLGAKEMTIGYGLTEASPLTHQTKGRDRFEQKVTTVGCPLPFTQAKIIDPQSGDELGDNQVGEIWVQGPNVMTGYYQNTEETEKAIVKGWLRTGDLGLRDHEGYYKIVGRLKEMIIVGGHNVYPAEIEQFLYSIFSEEAESIQIVGIPHTSLQEVVAAVMKLRFGKSLTEKEVIQRCQGQMEWSKIPRRVFFMDHFDKVMTVTGKIQKFKLRELLLQNYLPQH